MRLLAGFQVSVVVGLGCMAMLACAGTRQHSGAHIEHGVHAQEERTSIESFNAFRKRLDAAVLSIMNGDSRAWEEVYSHAPDATLFGGWGGHEKGWEELAPRWKMVAGRYRKATVEIERIAEHITNGLAVTVEIYRGEASFSDGSSGHIGLRVTHIYRRENGQWRLVHRHTDEQMRLQPIQSHIQK